MAGRKRHSAEDIVRKLRRADELAAEGKTGEEIAAELQVSVATLYNWRRTYGGMDVDAAKELKELREQNGRLKRLLAEAELEKGLFRLNRGGAWFWMALAVIGGCRLTVLGGVGSLVF